MITQSTTSFGERLYHDGGMWIHMYDDGVVILYHTCPEGSEGNVLLVDETYHRKCQRCGPISIPDDLWTLYVLLDGRGVYKDVE